MPVEQQAEVGVTITLKDIYRLLIENNTIASERIRKLEIQVAAQWVVIGIITVAIGAAVSKVFGG